MPGQSNALPYRLNGDSCEVLLVTSRRKGKWILPKGKIEPGETASQRAATEAFEEAGVLGTVSKQPVNASASFDPSRARVYALRVETELEQWPEMRSRKRAWFSLSEARSILQDEKLQRALQAFAAERVAATQGQ
ncbi:NUDIX hydrolase (plasmid) [Novosphingobium sp. BL-8A]|uniref:NUDIX hydrolase n=1 Tax=Novosphingobium sp. BL-8A TaxID=3127639 RepID=UPI00375846C4